MASVVTPNIGASDSDKTFKVGFTRLSIIALTGSTTATITANSSFVPMPIGLIFNFEAPNNSPHAEVAVTTTGTFLYQEYR
jgi:hypothetical protein